MHQFLIILNQRCAEQTITCISNPWNYSSVLTKLCIDDSNSDGYVRVCLGDGINSFLGSEY